MIRRGDRKLFKEFVSFVKLNKHSLNKIRQKLNNLIEQGVDLNQKGYMGKTLLHTAIQLKDKKLLQMFIKAGVYIDLADVNGNAPIHMAITQNRLDFVQILVKNNADVNIGAEMEETPLHKAVAISSLPIIEYLVDNGLDWIEVYHSNHTQEDEEEFLRLADKYNLLISGGSDYHGPNVKPDVELGTGKKNVKVKQLTLLDAIHRRQK